MRKPPYFDTMASGDLSIVLEDGVDYMDYSRYAKKWATRLSLNVVNTVDGLREKLLECERGGRLFWLAWDDWFQEISLEPQDHEAGEHIKKIAAEIGLAENAER